MRPLLFLLALTSMAAAKPTVVPPDALRADWTALMATGCNLVAHQVRTPMEASVLRNTPYALAGYIFKNTQLQTLFRTDGRWYAPRTNTPPALDPKTVACIRKLRALEAEMKTQVGNTAAFKRAAFVDRRRYWEIRMHSRFMMGGRSTLRRSSTSLSVRCPDCTDLNFYAFSCPVQSTSCDVNVPGLGDIPQD